MTPVEEELLVNSFKFSARRILEALNGNLSIRNSRDGSAPVVPAGMAVGLCGQGGRHVFFDLPAQDIEDAAQEILNLPDRAYGSALSRLQSICINLRQATNFYPQSGCVNDRSPRLVPWLPPEEIWAGHGEMPLDLWRLLSFDIDVVGTTLNMALDSADLSYTTLNQAALTFASLVRRAGDRIIEFQVDEGKMPPTLSFGSRRFRCSLMRLFFEAGSLLTPLSQKDDFSRWFLAFRYLDWLATGDTLLRVKRAFRQRSVDSRYKGIFSEEVAIGMMAVVLQDVYGSIRINNTAEIIDKPAGPVADFIALSGRTNPRYFKIECKGSLGNPVSSQRLARAKLQVGKTTIRGGTSLGLICSSSIYYEDQVKTPRCLIEDPPSLGGPIEADFDEPQAWRATYAKLLKFIGLERASMEIAAGEPAVSLPYFVDRERRKDEGGERRALRRDRLRSLQQRLHCESILDLGFGAAVVDSFVHRILREGISNESSRALEGYLREGAISQRVLGEGGTEVSFLNKLGVGLVVFEELNL